MISAIGICLEHRATPGVTSQATDRATPLAKGRSQADCCQSRCEDQGQQRPRSRPRTPSVILRYTRVPESPLNEAAWKRLLSQIRDACVVPVIGPELLVGRGGEGGLPRRIAVGAT